MSTESPPQAYSPHAAAQQWLWKLRIHLLILLAVLIYIISPIILTVLVPETMVISWAFMILTLMTGVPILLAFIVYLMVRVVQSGVTIFRKQPDAWTRNWQQRLAFHQMCFFGALFLFLLLLVVLSAWMPGAGPMRKITTPAQFFAGPFLAYVEYMAKAFPDAPFLAVLLGYLGVSVGGLALIYLVFGVTAHIFLLPRKTHTRTETGI